MKLRVAVIYGGRSGEHEVSLRSAESVIAAMNPARYEPVRYVIAKDGKWNPGPILPEPGKELEFIVGRHTDARAKSHPQRGMYLDPAGQFYRPGWWLSLRVAAGQTPPFRSFMLWRARRRLLKKRQSQPAPAGSVASSES